MNDEKAKAKFWRRLPLFIILNIVYNFGVLGCFVTWSFGLTFWDGMWWVQLLIFIGLINFHWDIVKAIDKIIKV